MWKGLRSHLLLGLRHFSSFWCLSLACSLCTTAQSIHHDGHHVLVHTQDADEVRVLEEDVVVHERPGGRRKRDDVIMKVGSMETGGMVGKWGVDGGNRNGHYLVLICAERRQFS